jgi:glycosyltransferase involved in cell wall biosynthesis
MNVGVAHGRVDGHSGSSRYVSDIASRLAEDGHHVTLVCHEQAAATADARVETIRIPELPAQAWRLGYHGALFNNRRHLKRALGDRRFDVLFGSDLLFLKPMSASYPSARFVYAPLSMIAPIEIESYALGGVRGVVGPKLYARLQRWALQTCDCVVRFTPSAVRALERYYDLDLTAKALVAVYVSRGFDDVVTAPRFDRPEPRQLLWVGRLVPSKNVAFLLRAAALLQSRHWVLHVCSDGPERPALEALSRSLGLTDRVRFLGAVDDMASVYRTASLLLTASVLEQYSLTLMEAYAMGVPCIGLRPDWKTVFNSNEDQIVDGVTGYVVDDERQMAERIDTLLADEPARQAMARAAYEFKVSRDMTFESFYAQLIQAFQPSRASLPEQSA